MKSALLIALLLFQLLMAPPVLPQDDSTSPLTDDEIQLLYGLFKDVNSFGIISLTLIGDATKAGLNEARLTSFLDERFRVYFCNTKYEDLSQNPAKLALAITSRDRSIGIISFRVWVIGEDYPLAYHVRCDAGSFENPSIWTEEVLGHGSRETIAGAIKDILNELMKQLADNFLTAKGEECVRKF